MHDAYAAGLFDGEGTVGVYASTNGKSSKVYWGVRLCVMGTHRPMIEALAAHFDRGLFTTQKRLTPDRRYDGPRSTRQGWRWQVTSRREVLAVLSRIRPHLIEKAAQADLALAFCRGELTGPVASRRLKRAKRFSFPPAGFACYRPYRTGSAQGTRNPAAKFSEAAVAQIKLALAAGRLSKAALGRIYGVSGVLIGYIASGRRWGHVPAAS